MPGPILIGRAGLGDVGDALELCFGPPELIANVGQACAHRELGDFADLAERIRDVAILVPTKVRAPSAERRLARLRTSTTFSIGQLAEDVLLEGVGRDRLGGKWISVVLGAK